MSTVAPPPLPGGKPRRTPAASFVDVLGKLSVLLAVVGVLYALVQLVALLLIPAGFMDNFLAGEYEFLPALPSLLHWLLQNLLPLAWATLFSAVAFLVISYGVMKRSNAARLGFIVFMVLGTLMNFASIALLIAALDWVNAIGASIDEAGVTQEVRGLAVVGHQPVLKPGERFEYSSWTRLATAKGSMQGSFFCVTENVQAFEAPVPPFDLDAGDAVLRGEEAPRVLH